jgi:catechol 2,3-dioxygenase-like lactoylglutathione lyase family enzyme
MRSLVLFVAGVLVGAAIQTAHAQIPPNQPAVRLNHVAIAVKDLSEALKFYQDKLGFREVVRNPNGQSAYVQIVEIRFRGAARKDWAWRTEPLGPEARTSRHRATFRQRTEGHEPGAKCVTGGILANINDPVYGRIELTEQPPDGKLRKASDSWK